jgi:hypothetical protein
VQMLNRPQWSLALLVALYAIEHLHSPQR